MLATCAAGLDAVIAKSLFKLLSFAKSTVYHTSTSASKAITMLSLMANSVAFSQTFKSSLVVKLIANSTSLSVVISTQNACTLSLMNGLIALKMKLGTRSDKPTPPGTFTVPRVAMLYSQPTVAPIVRAVVSPLTVSKQNLGSLPISLNKLPSTLYQDVPALC